MASRVARQGPYRWAKVEAGVRFRTYQRMVAEFQAAHQDEHGGPLVAMLSSVNPREGKTYSALNLAAAFALSGKRVLLVDIDACPSSGLFRRFTQRSGSGLAELAEGGELEDFAPLDVEPGFDVTSGCRPVATGQRAPLDAAQLGAALQAVTPDYDVILLDAEPLSAGPHVCALAASVGGLFYLVVRGMKTLHTDVKAAAAACEAAGCPVDGLVLNRQRDPVPRSLRRAMGSLVEDSAP